MTCAHCEGAGAETEMVESYERGPDGQPIKVMVHIDCLDEWQDRTDPLPGRAP